MREYPKIPGPYKRHTEGPNRNKLIEGAWTDPVLYYLQDADWLFTEKVDGTNIRVHWDGHKVTLGGRTERAQIPANLITVITDLFPEELMEQVFNTVTVTLYGEGYGAGINSGGLYRADPGFVLFDVLIDDWWLLRDAVEDIASKLGISIVPAVERGTLHDGIALIRDGLQSTWGDFKAEGVVGVPAAGLLDRGGRRIAVKLKTKDLTR